LSTSIHPALKSAGVFSKLDNKRRSWLLISFKHPLFILM
jgi:hypothetical protein